MIELIFALIIMSIVFISLPMIMVNNANTVEDNLIQESIFLTSSKMSQALTFKWDNNSTDPLETTLSTSDVVDVTNGAALLDRNDSDFRIGHFREDKHRRMTPIGATRFATPIGIEVAGVFDDIDDFDGLTDTNLMTIIPNSPSGYKKNYRADVNVSYIDDDNFLNATSYASTSIDFVLEDTAAPATTTNLKMIEVSIQQENAPGVWSNELILLRSYVANIGETDYFKRRY